MRVYFSPRHRHQLSIRRVWWNYRKISQRQSVRQSTRRSRKYFNWLIDGGNKFSFRCLPRGVGDERIWSARVHMPLISSEDRVLEGCYPRRTAGRGRYLFCNSRLISYLWKTTDARPLVQVLPVTFAQTIFCFPPSGKFLELVSTHWKPDVVEMGGAFGPPRCAALARSTCGVRKLEGKKSVQLECCYF